MKLNPPASSSDLEAARQIARRLHQQRRHDDQVAVSGPSEEAQLRPRLNPPPLPPRLPAADLPEVPEARGSAAALPLSAPAPPMNAPRPASALPQPHARREPSPPSPHALGPESSFEPAAAAPEPDLLEGLAEPTPFAAGEPQLTPEPELDVDLDETPLSPEEMVGEVEADASPLDQLTDHEASPFDDALLDAPTLAEEPAPPSWDDIVETCRGLAQARGAMLIDPAGQVFSTRGDWPAPGPEAIATKLVAMMAKTLTDAPTRSISAPLMGMHLTAWRVPLDEGLVTAAFIGTAPVRADARPAIDNEIRRGV